MYIIEREQGAARRTIMKLCTVLCLGVMLGVGAAAARAQTIQDVPVPPCAGTPQPAYPEVSGDASVRVWLNDDIAGWRPPDCAKLVAPDANAVIATAARFTNTMDSDAIAGRVARVSNYRLMRYYSAQRERWRPMISDAFALTDHPAASRVPDAHRRGDFAVADIETGSVLRYWVKDNSLLSGVIYRLTVRERTPDRLTFEMENETAMRFLVLDVVPAGAFRQLHVFEREPEHPSGDAWRYYALAMGQIKWFRPSVESFANRARSYFRHMAGLADASMAEK